MHKYSAFFSPVLPKKEQINTVFGWWKDFIIFVANHSTSITLECHSNNESGLQSCAALGAQNLIERQTNAKIETWTGSVSKPLVYACACEPFDEKQNRIKWNRLFFRKGSSTVASITRFGSEVNIHGFSMHDITFLEERIAPFGLSLCYWENCSNGNTVPLYQFFQ